MNRNIIHRTTGKRHGFINRMISPSDVGEITKPFVFLDFIDGVAPEGAGFGWHPHSGIATFTYHIEGGSHIEESTGHKVSFGPRDVEYLQAGSGAWHTGSPEVGTRIKGFQLWISLPPELEEEDSKSLFLKKEDFENDENVTVLLGEYNGMKSKIPPPNEMNYLEVAIAPLKDWTYTPPANHDVLWVQVFEGKLIGDIEVKEGELIVFEQGTSPVRFETNSGVSLILGSAKKFEHNLILGRSSVHTSETALRNSLEKINSIYSDLIRGKKL
ncbi:MAG: pirin family protein [Cytophagales bacterium]|nr:pirin family protein [Cytophagales bacterium]